MIEKILKKVAPFALALGIGATAISCPPPTPTPDPYAAERETVSKAADRLLLLQDNDGIGIDGSWDWIVTGHTAPTGTTYLNIAGVTAEGLLGAYKVTGQEKYLDGAKKTGDYLIAQFGNPVDITKSPNAFNVLFLYHLSEESGDNKYRVQADAMMNNLLHEDNYWAHNYGDHAMDDGIPGCTVEELINAEIERRSPPGGIIFWDLYKYVEAAKKFGDNTFANDLAQAGKAYIEDPTIYNPSTSCYTLGATWINAMKEAGLDYTDTLDKLLAAQQPDGTWQDENGIAQNTAYAIMTLMNVGNRANSASGVGLARDNQMPNGGWTENDGEEYSEVDSEIIQGLADYITK